MATTENKSQVTTSSATLGDGATLRESMKARAWDLHGVADKLLEGALLHKKMHVNTYKIYTASLYHMYCALEPAIANNSEHPQVAAIYFPEVNRVESLEQDLEFLYGSDWRQQIPRLPAIHAYAQHLTQIGEDNPVLLAAHAYVRYFGDLSGGQILKRVISRSYKFPADGSGVQFYDFSHIEDLKGFKALYASRLEAIDMDEETRQAVVDEARVAFQHNINFIRAIDDIIEQEEGRHKPQPVPASLPTKNIQGRHLLLLGISIAGLVSIAIMRVVPSLVGLLGAV